uniref:Thioredoxin domain-containing protein n=1 Tax=viral metagenome TaxID=1070528 RepID=A0A6C0HKP1_9ZZZZ
MHFKVLSTRDATNFSNKLGQGNWIVLFYSNSCGHCHQMKPEWANVVKKFKSPSSNIHIAEVESSYLNSMRKPPQIMGYPTIKFYNQGRIGAEYKGERLADQMINFAMSNSNSSKSNSLINSKNANTLNNSNNSMRFKFPSFANPQLIASHAMPRFNRISNFKPIVITGKSRTLVKKRKSQTKGKKIKKSKIRVK